MNRKLLVPGKINLAEVIALNPLPDRVSIAELAYIINLLFEIPLRKKDAIDKHGFVRINTQELRKVIRDPGKCLLYLRQSELLEMSPQEYIVGERSRAYRVGNKYVSKAATYDLTDSRIINRIDRQSGIKGGGKYKHISKWLPHVKIDTSAAMACIENELDNAMKTRKNDLRSAITIYNYRLRAIDNIESGYLFFNVDRTSGRMHSTFTSTPATIRPFLTYNEKRLYTADICNSQPFFSSVIFEPPFFSSHCYGDFVTIHDCYSTTSTILKEVTNSTYSLMFRESLQNNQCQDVTEFLKHSSDGNLYEFIAEKQEEKSISRDKAKSIMMTVMYEHHDTTRPWTLSLIEKFKKRFPNVYKGFYMFKKLGHPEFPVLMQKIEAIVMKRVAKRISNEMRSTFFLLIHDSVVTTNEATTQVKEIMLQEIEKATGRRPNIKVSEWE